MSIAITLSFSERGFVQTHGTLSVDSMYTHSHLCGKDNVLHVGGLDRLVNAQWQKMKWLNIPLKTSLKLGLNLVHSRHMFHTVSSGPVCPSASRQRVMLCV